MPELPEVETVRRELAPWLTSRVIRRARRADAPAGPKYAGLPRADGQRIEEVTRRGKFLVLPLSKGDELIIHLGMTGRITPLRPTHHLRVIVELSGRSDRELFFQDTRRFGRFLVVKAGDYAALPTLAELGPEPLEASFTNELFFAALQKSRAPVKTFVMGQRPVAGVGNIYADEALWRARIHPECPANRVSKAKVHALRDAIVELLTAAIALRGTTFSDYRTVGGELGGFAALLKTYGRGGEPCLRCETRLRRIVVGQRGTCFCPRCQRMSAQQRKPR
jgi:formamidopyrimidine-DNA glycosylase